MSSIDERIVEMKFNNGQFQSGVKSTLSSLESLNKAMNLDGAKKSLTDVGNATRGFKLDGVTAAISGVNTKFLAMATIGITALSRITSAAIATGTQMVKSLTIDPVAQGLEEYETKLNSVQTILANTESKGTTLTDVTGSLQELNDYADLTIYNFAEMTRNIGMFTAAGVDLETSTAAIKGIANLAAVSGSNSQQASTAMYQLSQALSTGTVKLMDWNSVVNAGMGGEVFQEALKRTARVQGVAVDDIIKKNGSFRDSLQEGWLTADILNETLSQISGDLNAKQLEGLGYNKQQIKEIEQLAKTATDAATKVKTATQLVGVLQEAVGSGWAQSFEIIFGDFEEAKELWTGVSDVLTGMIGDAANARNALLTGWDELGGRQAIIDGLAAAFDTLMTVLGPIKEAFRDIFPAVTAKQLADFSKSFRDFFQDLKPSKTTLDALGRTFKGVFAAMDIGLMVVKEIAGLFGDLFSAMFEGSGDFLELTASIGDWVVGVRDAIKAGDGLSDFFDGLGDILQVPIEMLKTFVEFLSGGFSGGAFEDSLGRVEDRMVSFSSVAQFFGEVWDNLVDGFKDAMSFMSPFFDAVGEMFSDLGKAISDAMDTGDFSHVLDAVNTGLLGGLVLLIRNFFKKGLDLNFDFGGGLVEGIKETFGGLTDVLGAMQANLKADTLIKIAGAVGILTVSVVALSLIDSGALTKSLTAITVMFTQLGAALVLIEKFATGPGIAKMPLVAAGLVILSGALLVMAGAVKIMSTMSWDELSRGLAGVAGGVLVMAGAVQLIAKGSGRMVAAGIGMTALAGGLMVLSLAIKTFSGISWGELGTGLAGVAGSLVVVAGAMQLMPKNMPLTALGLVAVGGALLVLSSALQSMAGMTWEEIGRGLVVLAGSLLILAGGLYLMTGTLAGAAALIVVSAALHILGGALMKMGGMSWEEVGIAMVALAGSLLILAGGLYLMTGALPGAAALLVVSAALSIFIPVLMLMSTLSWGELGMGLAVLASSLAVLAIAGLAILPAIPGLMLLGTAIVLLGVGTLAAGVGLLAFATGLTALAAAGTAGAAGLTAMATAIINLIPMAMEAVGRGIVAIADVIATSGPAIVNALVTVLESLIKAVDKVIPQLLKLGVKLITQLLNAIDIVAPKIIDTGVRLIKNFVNAIVDLVPWLVDAGLRLITGLLQGIADNVQPMIQAGVNIIEEFLEGISQAVPDVVDAGMQMVIDTVNGIAESIRTNQTELETAAENLADAMIDAFVGATSNVGQIGLDIVSGIAGGITSGLGTIASAATEAAGSALAAAKAKLGIASPSKEFKKIGKWVNEGFAQGLTGDRSQVKAAYWGMNSDLKDFIKSTNQELKSQEKALKDLRKEREALKKEDGDNTKALKKNEKQIKKLTASMKENRKEVKAATKARNYLRENLDDERNRLYKLANEYDKVTEKLNAARQKLADARTTRDDYRKSIKDQYDNLAAFESSENSVTTLDEYIAANVKKVEDTNAFATQLQKLRNMGLNDKLYKELLSKGSEALPFVEELLAGGQAGINDINSLNSDLNKAASKLGSTASTELYQAGVDAARGLVDGLKKEQAQIDKAMERIADKMVKAIKKRLKIKSPSRVFAEVGKFTNQGLVKGLDDTSKDVEASAKEVGDRTLNTIKSAMSNMSNIIDSNLDISPTIRPVLDLSDVQAGANRIGAIVGGSQLETGVSYSRASNISSSESAYDAARAEDVAMVGGVNLTYTQNNYSPESLSNAEIYRNTKNQLSKAKGGLKSNA